ncbi:putative methyltransferase-domain-containing protein [Flammula alnicola]|nr:putative methyltransferase-domain-containing protein [Flammula alnicola]
MPKARKHKNPIVSIAAPNTSIAAQSCRNTIRKYHILLKRRRQLENSNALGRAAALTAIEQQISDLGGLERYQQLSSLGQREERGGGSEKIFIQWMKELGVHRIPEGKAKVRLLEVGALKPDNYQSCSSWIDWRPIDLRSRHPRIIEQDFLCMDLKENEQKWDAISLSLVLNFVPLPVDRGMTFLSCVFLCLLAIPSLSGRMLRLAHSMLVPDGLMFLALPLPCVANSRYVTFEHLKSLVESLGFSEIRERWRQNGKMGYWLYRKRILPEVPIAPHSFNKKTVLRTGNRNNFTIILDNLAGYWCMLQNIRK